METRSEICSALDMQRRGKQKSKAGTHELVELSAPEVAYMHVSDIARSTSGLSTELFACFTLSPVLLHVCVVEVLITPLWGSYIRRETTL